MHILDGQPKDELSGDYSLINDSNIEKISFTPFRFTKSGFIELGDANLQNCPWISDYTEQVNRMLLKSWEDDAYKLNSDPEKERLLFLPARIDGIDQSITRNDYIEGIGVFEQATLLLNYTPQQNIGFWNLIDFTVNSENIPIYDRKLAALISLRVCVPMARLFEDPESIRKLQDSAFKLLDPLSYSLANLLWREKFGHYPTPKEEVELKQRIHHTLQPLIGEHDIHFRVKSLFSFFLKTIQGRSTDDAYAMTICVPDENLPYLPNNLPNKSIGDKLLSHQARLSLLQNELERTEDARLKASLESRISNINKEIEEFKGFCLFNGVYIPLNTVFQPEKLFRNGIYKLENDYENTHGTGKPYNNEYRVISFKATSKIHGIVHPSEVRIATRSQHKKNNSNHPHYKITNLQSFKIGQRDSITISLGDHAHSLITNSPHNFESTDEEIARLKEVLRNPNYINVNTDTGRNLVILEQSGSVLTDLENYVREISPSLFGTSDGYRVIRLERNQFGELETQIYTVKLDDTTIGYSITKTNSFGITYTLSNPHEFHLQNYDNVSSLRLINSDLVPFMSVGRLLNNLAFIIDFDLELSKITFRAIKNHYPELDDDYLDEIKQQLIYIRGLDKTEQAKQIRGLKTKIYRYLDKKEKEKQSTSNFEEILNLLQTNKDYIDEDLVIKLQSLIPGINLIQLRKIKSQLDTIKVREDKGNLSSIGKDNRMRKIRMMIDRINNSNKYQRKES